MKDIKSIIAERLPEMQKLARDNTLRWKKKKQAQAQESKEWTACLEAVKGFTRDLEPIVKRYVQEYPQKVKYTQLKDKVVYDIELNTALKLGFECTLVVVYDGDIIKKARYIAWNDKQNTYCLRDMEELEIGARK